MALVDDGRPVVDDIVALLLLRFGTAEVDAAIGIAFEFGDNDVPISGCKFVGDDELRFDFSHRSFCID